MQSSVNRHLLSGEVYMNTQLKDCPFCGKEAKSYLQTYDTPLSEPYCYMQIGCMSCGIFFSTHHFRIVDKLHIPNEEVQECINAWNNRVI